MYAIVKTGGKQYRVERGQRLLVERLAVEEGDDIALEPILYRSDEAVFDKAGLESVKVTAKVLAHVRGEKLRVFKFKPKRGYKRRTGHRQDLTQIEVTEIAQGKAKAAARASTAKADTAEKPAHGKAKAAAGASTAKADAAEKPATGKAKAGGEAKTGKAGEAKAVKASKVKEEPSDGS
jgi:large subunit ribosomal protein L21